MPRYDLDRAMLDGVPDLLADLEDDTANVLLTLARIWNTLATGVISPKDVAADWAMERLPVERQAGLVRARAVYVGDALDRWDDLRARSTTLVAPGGSSGVTFCRRRRSAPAGAAGRRTRPDPRRDRDEDALS